MQQNGVSGGRWELHHSAIRKRLDEVWGCSFEDYYKTITSASPNAPTQSPTKMAIVSPLKGMEVCRLKLGRSSVSESCRSTPNGKWRGATVAAEKGCRKRVARMDASDRRAAKKPRDEIGLMLDEFTNLPPLLSPLREVTSLHPTTAQPSPKPPPEPAVEKKLVALSNKFSVPEPTIVKEPAAAPETANDNDKVSSSKSAPAPKCVVGNGKVEASGVASIVSSSSSKRRLNGDEVMLKAFGTTTTCKLHITSIPTETRKLLFDRWKARGAEKAPHRSKPKHEETEKADRGSNGDVKATAAAAENASKKMKPTKKPIRDADSRSTERANKVPVVEVVEAESQARSNTGPTVSQSHTPSSSNGVHPRSPGKKSLSRAPTDEIPNEESTPQFKFSLEEAVEARKRTSEGYRDVARTTKHRADKELDRTQKNLLYLEATLYFALSAIAERGVDAEKSKDKAQSTQNNKPAQPSPQQLYLPLSRSLDFLRSSTSTFANNKPDSPHMRRYRRRVKFLGSLLDACLSYQLYRLRSEEAYQNYNLLKEQRAEKSNCAVTEKHEATPSPASTSSSSRPASAKSEAATTAPKDMVQLPSSVHQLLLRQNQILTHLLWAHRLWDEANSTATTENKGLLSVLNGLCGELKLDSDVPHLVTFFGTATKWMQRQYGNELKKLAAAGADEAAPP